MTSRMLLARLVCISPMMLSGVPLAAQQLEEPTEDRTDVHASPLANYERAGIDEEAENADEQFVPQTRQKSVLPGTAGQPRLDPLLTRDPLARFNNRIENRIPNRLQTRLDRNYSSLNNPASSYASAETQARKRQKPPR